MRRWGWMSVLGMSIAGSCFAQEAAPTGGLVLKLEAATDGSGNLVIGQVDGDFGAGMPLIFNGVGGPMNDELGVALDAQFQDEIGLVPEQKEKLVALRQRISERRQGLAREVRAAGQEKAGQVVADYEKQIRDDVKKSLGEILLPHQVDRIRQIRVQSQLRNRGVMAISRGELGDALALTDQQKANLAEKQKKAERELREKIDQLRKEMQKELLDEVLTPQQRETLAKLTGPEARPKPVELTTPRLNLPTPKADK